MPNQPPAAAPAPVVLQAPVPGISRAVIRADRHRRHVLMWVFLGAMASGTFAVGTVAVLLMAYYSKLIGLAAIQQIAWKIWPFVCLTEISLQIIPMIVRKQTEGPDVPIDEVTSYLPMFGSIFFLGAMYFGGFTVGSEGWQIWSESFFVGFIELLLIVLTNKLIAAARSPG